MAATRKPAAKPAAKTETPATAFDMPEFDFAKLNESFREFVEKGLSQHTDAYDKMKTASEEATAAVEDSFNAVRSVAEELSTKAIANTKANADANAAFVEKMMGAKSFSEALDIQSSFFRSQFESIAGQAKEAQELTAKAGEKVLAPAKTAFEKSVA